MTYYIETLGCQMNSSDSEIIRGSLEGNGFVWVESPDEADILLLNTCAVREHAERRAIGRISSLRHYKKGGRGRVLGVLGCMAQHYGMKLMSVIQGVDLVMGPDRYRDLPGVLRSLVNGDTEAYGGIRPDSCEMYDGITPRRTARTSAWIPIMRGCDRFCSYCIVPYVRGRERSRYWREVLKEVAEVVEGGVPEVVFLGQNVSSYANGGVDFPGLLRKVMETPGLKRIRFITSHPLNITNDLIQVMKESPVICNSLHLPLQSGSERILRTMNRGYTLSDYRERITRLREAIPGIAISTDLMVGFPGESEEDFQQTLNAVRDIEFDSAYQFKYSPRTGTRAASFPDQIPEDVASSRLTKLIDLQREITARRNRALVGSIVQVLIEGRAKRGDGMFLARTEGNKMIVFRGNGDRIGSFRQVRIVGTTGATLVGEPWRPR